MDWWWLMGAGGAVLASIGALLLRRAATAKPIATSTPAPSAPTPSPAPPSTPKAQPAPETPKQQAPMPTPDPASDHPYEIKVKGVYQFWTPVEFAVESSPRVDAPWGGKVTAMALRDSRTGGYARLRYADAQAWAKAHGGSLLTVSQQDQLSLVGIMLPPFTLPGSSPALMAKGYQAGGPQMSSLEWAMEEDRLIDEALKKAGWDGQTIVNNAGKDWIADAPPGKAINSGWYNKSSKYGKIQPPSTAHGPDHTDYSQLTRVVWP